MASSSPRILRVASDDESVTLYQAFPNEIAYAAVQLQSLERAPGFSTSRMTWFKSSFTQMMQVSNYGTRDARRSRILASRITYSGLEDILRAGRLSYAADVTTSGVVDTSAPVHIIWDVARTPMGMKNRTRKSMHIGISGNLLVQLVNGDILSIEDVTDKAYALKNMIDHGDQAGAEAFIAELNEENIPVEDEVIEGRLGML